KAVMAIESGGKKNESASNMLTDTNGVMTTFPVFLSIQRTNAHTVAATRIVKKIEPAESLRSRPCDPNAAELRPVARVSPVRARSRSLLPEPVSPAEGQRKATPEDDLGTRRFGEF